MNDFEIDMAAPGPRQLPLMVAPDTFVIRAVSPSVGGTWTNLSSMIIRAAEPIIVDTGMVIHRTVWFDDVFSLVAPEDVRWIFISHIDGDHAGNVVEALDRCPNARIVTSRGESYRMSACLGVPFERMHMTDHGQMFDVGDRMIHAVRPPVYDSPYTRGLFDPVTRVYYASDAFCAPMPEHPVDWTDEMPESLWADGLARFHHSSVCPWISMVDQKRFQAEVDKLAALDIKVIVGAHTPAIRGSAVPVAFDMLARLPLYHPH